MFLRMNSFCLRLPERRRQPYDIRWPSGAEERTIDGVHRAGDEKRLQAGKPCRIPAATSRSSVSF